MSQLIQDDDLIKHTILVSSATFLAGLVNYSYHIYMSRVLGPTDYGVLNSVIALLMILSIPVGTISLTTAKYIAECRAQNKYREMSSLFLRALRRLSIWGVILSLLLLAVSPYIGRFLRLPTLVPINILAFLLLFSLIRPAFMGTLQGMQFFFCFAMILFLTALLKFSLGALFVHWQWGVNGALSGIFLASILTLCLAIVPTRFLFRERHHIDYALSTKAIYKYSNPVTITLLLFSVLAYLDIIIVKHFFHPETAGYYATASLIGKAFFFLPASVSKVLFPKVASHTEGSKKLYCILRNAILLAVIPSVIGLLICFWWGEYVVLSFFGKQYLSIIPLVKVFGLAVIPLGIVYVLVHFNLAQNKRHYLPVLCLGVLAELLLLSLLHQTLKQIVLIVGIVNVFILVVIIGTTMFVFSHSEG